MGTCINLRERFGVSYRITFDATCDAYPGLKTDPWMLEIPCRSGGRVYPYDATQLIYATAQRRLALRILDEVPGAVLFRDADDGIEIRFDVSLFDRLAPIIRPMRRRNLSAEHREKLATAGRKFRPRPRKTSL